MDNGNIVESGTHAELLSAQGFYSRLHKIQFSDKDVAL
jgi:ABC-type multidrug transport system fused ATPase/permease subunit